MLALSTTIDVELTQLVMSSCDLSKSVKTVSECTNRENVQLCVIKIKEKAASFLKCLLDSLLNKGCIAPKVIVYCRTKSIWLAV